MTKLPWKPWHEVLKLRDDLRTGDLALNMFAADLYEVMMQRGKRTVYEDPDQFFSLTYPTYNLRRLVREVVLRLAAKNDKAVRQLELTYGGGKTHTLITLRHLVNDPDSLPNLPAVEEFIQDIGQRPPRCRIAALCFDKLDLEKGMDAVSPEGKVRMLKQPWSVLAWQLAGESGLRLLHAEGAAEERETAPAENLLAELLEIPGKDGLGTLVLIDEVLMYARAKVAQDREWRIQLQNFFQYLTQAVAKVDRCCLVASLLASDPRKSDTLGRELQGELYDIFLRQREEAVEPVVKEDVAEVLRRRFFKPESLKDRESFRPHIVAALKGITSIDEQTAKEGASAEQRFLDSYPFHPDLTEVLYSKWTQLTRFQKTRGILRTFALALREAEKWDRSPLICSAVFLNDQASEGLSEALREMVTVADTEETEGKKQAWTGILDNEFEQARRIQKESMGLKFREVEQAVVATFLHSQPIGQTAKTRDLLVLLGLTRPDKIELEKGLTRWAQTSYWLDDLHTSAAPEGQLPGTWRLGNRPNLNQMHVVAMQNIPDPVVRSRLLDEIGRLKLLTKNASASGVRPHTLPIRPKDIEDDGVFHYAILGPDAASESGKPSPEARKYLDETTSPDKPRVYRNAVVLLTPSKDGLELASAAIRDYLGWESVREDIKHQQKEGSVDPARAQTLAINLDKSKGRIPDRIGQAWCIVVTVSEKDEAQAFKISVTGDPHFDTIKADKRSRMQDTPVTAEALLPDGPYNLWRPNETSRRVKDLSGAFAQLPHLPKMIKASAILGTLAEGGLRGIFVLRLVRPDGTLRTWWMAKPDDVALNDPALELVLPEAAELNELPSALLAIGCLPGLWTADEITVRDVIQYFSGDNVMAIERDGYQESLPIPKVSEAVLEKAIAAAVENSVLWLRNGPASILGESIPAGVLNADAKISPPPPKIPAPTILSENLPNAWKDGEASGLSISSALSIQESKTLPWKTIRDAISDALQARFLKLSERSAAWPCDFSAAQSIILKPQDSPPPPPPPPPPSGERYYADADLEPAQLQELGDIVPKLLDVKKSGVPMRFRVRIEVGDGITPPPENAVNEVNRLLRDVKESYQLKK